MNAGDIVGVVIASGYAVLLGGFGVMCVILAVRR